MSRLVSPKPSIVDLLIRNSLIGAIDRFEEIRGAPCPSVNVLGGYGCDNLTKRRLEREALGIAEMHLYFKAGYPEGRYTYFAELIIADVVDSGDLSGFRLEGVMDYSTGEEFIIEGEAMSLISAGEPFSGW